METAVAEHELTPKHPFRIEHIFFAKILLKRAGTLPEQGVEVGLTAEVAFGFHEDPTRFTVTLRVRSADTVSPPLRIEVIALGAVQHIREGSPSDDEFIDFVNDHLLAALSSRVVQLIGTTTAQMGMPPIWLPMPTAYGLDVNKYRAMKAGIAQAGHEGSAPPAQ